MTRAGLLGGFLALERWLTRCAVVLAAAALVLAVAVGLYQVLARFVLAQPSTWSEVLMRTLIVWMVFLGSAGAFRAGALVSVDLLYRLSGARLRRLLAAFIALASLLLLGVMLWFGYQMIWRVRFQVLAGLDISIAWAYAAIPVGAAFSMVSAVAHYLDPGRERPDLL